MEFDHTCIFASAVYGIYKRLGPPKLFHYADQGLWDLIPERARKFPKETMFVHKYAPCDTALHRLLRPLHGVTCTTAASPNNDKATCTIDASTPNSSSNEVDLDRKYLRSTDVLTHQELQQAKEKERLLEIDPAMTNLLLGAVESILEVNPDAASHPNLFGRTALHLACMDLTPARVQAVTLLLQYATPHTVLLEDRYGCTAMHYLMQNPSNQIPRELMLTFLKHDGFAMERKNNNGQTPLDIFVAFCQDKTSVRAEALEICQLLGISTTLTSADVVVGQIE